MVARILSTNPALDAIQVRNMLVNAALVDDCVTADGTRAVPNEVWGYGKLDTAVGVATPLPSDLRITTDVLPEGVVGQAVQRGADGQRGTLPYAWSIASGGLPAGLTLSGGVISGTPRAGGQAAFT